MVYYNWEYVHMAVQLNKNLWLLCSAHTAHTHTFTHTHSHIRVKFIFYSFILHRFCVRVAIHVSLSYKAMPCNRCLVPLNGWADERNEWKKNWQKSTIAHNHSIFVPRPNSDGRSLFDSQTVTNSQLKKTTTTTTTLYHTPNMVSILLCRSDTRTVPSRFVPNNIFDTD